jgi:hypothetical protein
MFRFVGEVSNDQVSVAPTSFSQSNTEKTEEKKHKKKHKKRSPKHGNGESSKYSDGEKPTEERYILFFELCFIISLY